mgnify:CR=1 FL=1
MSKTSKAPFFLWSAGLGLGLALAQQALPFKDVPPTLEDIRFLYEKGILQGYPDGTFRGREYLTRYQAAAMLYRAYLAFADDVAKRVKEALAQDLEAKLEEALAQESGAELGEALAQDFQAKLEEALSAVKELQEAVRIVQEALGDYPEVKGILEETRKGLEDLADELAQVSAQSVTREEIGDLISSVGALEGLIKRSEESLQALQTKVSLLEAALRDLEGRTQAAQGELNKRVHDLGAQVEALKKRKEDAPRLTLGGSVGLSGGRPSGEVFVRGEAKGVLLDGRVASDGAVGVRLEGGGVFLEGRARGGVSESRAGYRLFEGISLSLELGYGDAPFGVVRVLHGPEGGLIPGLVAEAGAGAGFHQGSLSRNVVFVAAGYRVFGAVTPSLGYYRYQGEVPYSLLEGRVNWGADWGSLEGYYRLVAFPGSGDRGSEWGVRFASMSNPFVELGVRGAEGLVSGEPGSFTFRYQNATGSQTDFTVRVGYRLEF